MRSWSRRNSLLDSGRGRMRGRFAAVGHRPLHSGVPLAHSEPDDATARRAAAAGGARTCTTEEFSPLLKVFDLEQVRLVDFHPIHPLPGTSAGLDGRLPGVDAGATRARTAARAPARPAARGLALLKLLDAEHLVDELDLGGPIHVLLQSRDEMAHVQECANGRLGPRNATCGGAAATAGAGAHAADQL